MATDPHQSLSGNLQDPSFSEERDPLQLREKAARCRRLASGVSDRQAADILRSMAATYERDADLTDRN